MCIELQLLFPPLPLDPPARLRLCFVAKVNRNIWSICRNFVKLISALAAGIASRSQKEQLKLYCEKAREGEREREQGRSRTAPTFSIKFINIPTLPAVQKATRINKYLNSKLQTNKIGAWAWHLPIATWQLNGSTTFWSVPEHAHTHNVCNPPT